MWDNDNARDSEVGTEWARIICLVVLVKDMGWRLLLYFGEEEAEINNRIHVHLSSCFCMGICIIPETYNSYDRNLNLAFSTKPFLYHFQQSFYYKWGKPNPNWLKQKEGCLGSYNWKHQGYSWLAAKLALGVCAVSIEISLSLFGAACLRFSSFSLRQTFALGWCTYDRPASQAQWEWGATLLTVLTKPQGWFLVDLN